MFKNIVHNTFGHTFQDVITFFQLFFVEDKSLLRKIFSRIRQRPLLEEKYVRVLIHI